VAEHHRWPKQKNCRCFRPPPTDVTARGRMGKTVAVLNKPSRQRGEVTPSDGVSLCGHIEEPLVIESSDTGRHLEANQARVSERSIASTRPVTRTGGTGWV